MKIKTVLALLLGGALVFSAAPSSPPTKRKKKKRRNNLATQKAANLAYLPLFKKYAGKAGLFPLVPLELALTVAHGEGTGNPNAKSWAGAVGLMQLMPNTARGLGLCVRPQPGEKKIRKQAPRCAGQEVDERYDPEKNIFAGVKLLDQLLRSQGGSWDRVLAAYNSGNPNPALRHEYIKYIRAFLPLYAEYKE